MSATDINLSSPAVKEAPFLAVQSRGAFALPPIAPTIHFKRNVPSSSNVSRSKEAGSPRELNSKKRIVVPA
jgi:hypothetical protein